MYCQKCGTTIEDNAEFCYQCGERRDETRYKMAGVIHLETNMMPIITITNTTVAMAPPKISPLFDVLLTLGLVFISPENCLKGFAPGGCCAGGCCPSLPSDTKIFPIWCSNVLSNGLLSRHKIIEGEILLMEQKYCQCCAMPMDNAGEMYGTNSEGFFPYTETLERQIIIEKA